MNRYKKKVVLKEEAKVLILPFEFPSTATPPEEWFKEHPAPLLNVEEVFGNKNPLEIEVGFGTGKFLIAAGAQFPETNYLGLEITRKMVHHVANQILENNLPNVRVVLCDGRQYMRQVIAEASVERVHVYFPDPWVKKRHLKRRVMNQDFFESVFRVIKKGGHLNLFTDHQEYFEYFLEQRAIFGKFEDAGEKGFYTPTGYELKWTREGRSIYRAVLRKP